MCAITGFISFKDKVNPRDFYKAHLLLRHRGPDDEGFISINDDGVELLKGDDTSASFIHLKHINESQEANILLGHRRLSIIDLSDIGHQPMSDESGRYYISYNGEIYNYKELRKELESLGYKFFSDTDTEVLLKAYIEWGGVKLFTKLNGMWAFVIYDSKTKDIFVSRDRFGVKPLYYYHKDGKLYFASELRFIKKFIDLEININTSVNFLYSFIQDCDEETFYKDVFSLSPGHYLIFNKNGLKKYKYWDYEKRESNAELFGKYFTNSLNLRVRSDVPIGAMLSGGLDSTLIVSQLFKDNLVGKGFKAFSAVFKDDPLSEEEFIKDTQALYNVDVNYLFLSDEDIIVKLDKILNVIEEPFRDLSVFLQYSIYENIKSSSDIKVVLNGQGSDEVFGGYNHHYYYIIDSYIEKFNFYKAFIEAKNFKKYRHNSYLDIFKELLRLNLAPFFNKDFIDDEKFNINNVKKKVLTHKKGLGSLTDKLFLETTTSPLREYLKYEDKNSMAFSIESRLPFMDYELIQWAFGLEDKYKINNGINKKIVRDYAKNFIVSSVLNRKDKIGFLAPHHKWQNSLLKNSIIELLNNAYYPDFINKNSVLNLMNRYYEGDGSLYMVIWRYFIYIYWFNKFKGF